MQSIVGSELFTRRPQENLEKDDSPDSLDRAMSRRLYGEVFPGTFGWRPRYCLLGIPVTLFGHPGMLRVGYHRVEQGAFSACLRGLVG